MHLVAHWYRGRRSTRYWMMADGGTKVEIHSIRKPPAPVHWLPFANSHEFLIRFIHFFLHLLSAASPLNSGLTAWFLDQSVKSLTFTWRRFTYLTPTEASNLPIRYSFEGYLYSQHAQPLHLQINMAMCSLNRPKSPTRSHQSILDTVRNAVEEKVRLL
jgi:hypothetical protein